MHLTRRAFCGAATSILGAVVSAPSRPNILWITRRLGDRAAPARGQLAAAMRQSPSLNVRMDAAELLCRLGDVREPLAVLKEYLSHQEPWTRMHAAVTLGRLGKRAIPAVPALRKAAADKENYPKLAAENALLYINSN
jgi:HEAT repeat protein